MACENQLLSGEHGFATPSCWMFFWEKLPTFDGLPMSSIIFPPSNYCHLLSRVQTPKCRPFVYTYWLVENGIPHSWIVIIPNILVSSPIVINQ
jgi:hypothetical protein